MTYPRQPIDGIIVIIKGDLSNPLLRFVRSPG